MKLIVAILLFSTMSLGSSAHDDLQVSPDSLLNRLEYQTTIYPQEKIHLHTDKSVYVAGEKIWIRAYLTDAMYHLEALSMSRYIYIDLVDPIGAVISSLKLCRNEKGLFYGDMFLDLNLSQGNYRLLAYTNYMLNKPDYLFTKEISIYDVRSYKIDVEAKFDFNRRESFDVKFLFQDIMKSTEIDVDDIEVKFNESDFKELGRKSSSVNFRYNKNETNILNVKFKYQDRLYSKYIKVPEDHDFDVTFYPEGGYIISGRPCRVSFKSLRSDGFSEKINLVLYDEDDNSVTSTHSFHAGLGQFLFTPRPGVSYYVICENESGMQKRFDIPLSHDDAISLVVYKRSDEYSLFINSPDTFEKRDDYLLLLHFGGFPIYCDQIGMNMHMKIKSSEIPTGIIQALLLDNELNPVSERLFFNKNNENSYMTEINLDKALYDPRSRISVSLDFLKESAKYPLDGFLSVSVTDDGDVEPDTLYSLPSSLLLTSEIRGHIEDPAYFLRDNILSERVLDILMTTHGWRRYDIPSLLRGRYESPEMEVEQGDVVSGKVISLIRRTPISGSPISAFSLNSGFLTKVETDSAGRFEFSGFESPDSTNMIVQAMTPKGKNTVELLIDDTKKSKIDAKSYAPPLRSDYVGSTLLDYVEKSEKKYISEYGEESILLNQAVITAMKPINSGIYSSTQAMVYPSYSSKEIEDQNITDMASLLSRFPSVFIQDGVLYFRIVASSTLSAGLIPAVVIIDDVMHEQFDILHGIAVHEIESIAINKFGFGLGMRGGGGAVIITLKKGSLSIMKNDRPNIKKLTVRGYDVPSEFYSPKYETRAQIESPAPDLRTTLFWRADVKVNEGLGSFEFYSADKPSTYTIIVEGIGSKGELIRAQKQIKVEYKN